MPATEFDTPEDEEVAKKLKELLDTPTDFEPEEIDPDELVAGDEEPEEDEIDDDDLEDEDNPPDDLADDSHLVEESSELPNN